MVTVAEVAPAAIVPLNVEAGSVPPKSAAFVVPLSKVPENETAPVVSPLRVTVKVRVFVPLSPSFTETVAGENETVCAAAGAATVNFVVGNAPEAAALQFAELLMSFR